MLTHNNYFEGRVQSIGFDRNGRRHTVGVVDTGEFHFGTDAAERMTVVSGELLVKLPGSDGWRCYPAGTAFEARQRLFKFPHGRVAPARVVCFGRGRDSEIRPLARGRERPRGRRKDRCDDRPRSPPAGSVNGPSPRPSRLPHDSGTAGRPEIDFPFATGRRGVLARELKTV